MLRRTGATRGASDPVTLQINSLSAVGIDWALVGLAISSDTAPTLTGTNPRYLFTVQTTDQGANWCYRVVRDGNNGLFNSALIPSGSLALPIRLDIVRNGANYDFKRQHGLYGELLQFRPARLDGVLPHHLG